MVDAFGGLEYFDEASDKAPQAGDDALAGFAQHGRSCRGAESRRLEVGGADAGYQRPAPGRFGRIYQQVRDYTEDETARLSALGCPKTRPAAADLDALIDANVELITNELCQAELTYSGDFWDCEALT